MAPTRRVIEQKPEDLAVLIPSYKDAKTQEDSFKKVADDFNKRIKLSFKLQGIDEFVVGDIKATVTTKENEDFNELQAIEILRTALSPEDFAHCVKTREYLDDDCFEDLVYNNKVDAGILMPCRSPKDPTTTLRLGKVK